jgi:hypothetical protein
MTDLDRTTLVRHLLATLSYRAGKVLRGMPPEVATFSAGGGVRTPGELLAHLSDLSDWAASAVRGAEAWNPLPPGAWENDIERFFAALKTLDDLLAQGVTLDQAEHLLQGALADSLAHVGQLALLRRLAGDPIRSENYSKAEITPGRVGREQTAPRFEF